MTNQTTLDNHASISIITPNNKSGYIIFGDPQDNDVGRLEYDHANDRMNLIQGGGIVQTLTSGNVGIGTTAPKSALHVADGKYLQAEDNNAGAPPAADCDSDTERGRISFDTANSRLYFCAGASRGWDFAELND